jgi:hypothetical protein
MKTDYFCGNRVSDYGRKYHRLDYLTLSKAFNHVLCNDIMAQTERVGLGEWEPVCGWVDNAEEIEELEERIDELENSEKDNSGRIEELQERLCQLEDEQGSWDTIYQWFIVSDQGVEILQDVNEPLWYNSALNMYLWGVTHCGTSWDYVLTNVRIVKGDDNE